MSIRIGVVGLGKIGERHLNAYSSMKDVEIGGICDINLELLKHTAANLNVQPFESVDALLESDISAVDICTPTEYHHNAIIKALDNGKHVFCEKPLTYSMEYAQAIKEKSEQTGKVIMVGYLYRFHPSFELLRDIIKKNIIGKPYYASFRLGGRGGHRAWKHKANTAGGATFDMLTHMLDLALLNFGEPTEIEPLYSDIILKERMIDGELVQVDAEDCTLSRLRTNGTQIFLQSDLITPSFMNTVEVHGDNGSFFGSIVSRFPTTVYCKEPIDIYDRGENVFNFAPINLIAKELGYFVDCITNGSDPTNSVYESIKIIRITEELKRKTLLNNKLNRMLEGQEIAGK